jgi:hypothetical protein
VETAVTPPGAVDGIAGRMSPAASTKRTYHVLGVSLRAGSLYSGSENGAQP